MPKRRRSRAPTLRIGIEHRLAKEPDASPARRQQPDDLAQQGRLAAARATDQAKHLPGLDVEIDIAMDHEIAELRAQAPNLDRRQRLRGGGQAALTRAVRGRASRPQKRHRRVSPR
jgi:hypothetical protein